MLSTTLLVMAYQYIGTPYKWGGNNYDGLDCSGMVLKAMHDVGITLPDMTAQNLYKWMLRSKFQSCEPEADCLLFFGKNLDQITHVSIAMNNKYAIESGGAGKDSLFLDDNALARLDARCRIKPIDNRRDMIACIKLTY